MKNKLNILYVDDEVNNLNSFKASFRRRYNVFLAKNTNEAKKILKERNVSIVVSDHKMPGQTGVEFLTELANNNPNIVRILITGYGDYELALESINKGKVFRFLNKPWNEAELKATLIQAEEHLNLMENKDQFQNAYFNLFNETPKPLILVNYSNLRIEKVNLATTKFFEFDEDELIGKDLDFLLSRQPYENPEKVALSIARSYKIKTKDGDIKEIEFYPKKIFLDNKQYFLITITDLSRSLSEEKNRQRLVLKVQNEEREKFSIDLHDSIAQDLVLLNLALEAQLGKRKKYKKIKNIFTILQKIMRNVRDLSYDLTPPELKMGLKESFERLFEKYDAASSIVFKFEACDNFVNNEDELVLNQDERYDLYRIIQSFITNSVQHAKCSVVSLKLDIQKDRLTLTISDNGCGFDFDKIKLGKGIQHMITRANAHDFRLNWKSEINRGTTLKISRDFYGFSR